MENAVWVPLVIGKKVEILGEEVSPACKPGENYVSKVSRVSFHYKEAEEPFREFSKSVIVKKMFPQDAPQCLIMDCQSMFSNEIVAYGKVIPALKKLGGLSVPLCYYTTPSMLVLEDLAGENFQMADRRVGLNLGECQEAIKAIGQFHARSFTLRRKEAKLFVDYTKCIKETVFCESYQGQLVEVFWENALWAATESLRNSEDETLVAMCPFFEKFRGKVLETLRMVSRPNNKFAVLCHGDLWCNNILFSYNEDSIPYKAKLLDFQAMRYSSCYMDLLHLLCTSTEPGLLGTHLTSLLSTYYQTLTHEIGTSPPFSLEELEREFRNNLIYGILLSFLMIPCATNEPQSSGEEVVLEKAVLETEKIRREIYMRLNETCHLRIRRIVSDFSNLTNINPL